MKEVLMEYTIIHTNKGFITGWSSQFNTFDTSVTVQESGALLFPAYITPSELESFVEGFRNSGIDSVSFIRRER